MGLRSLTKKVAPGNVTVLGATFEAEEIGKVSPVGSTRRTVVELEPCDCQYCRAARSRNISPLAAIDVYSLPAGTDVRSRAPERSH